MSDETKAAPEKTYTLDELTGDKVVEEPKDREKPAEPKKRILHYGWQGTLTAHCGAKCGRDVTGLDTSGYEECAKCAAIRDYFDRQRDAQRRALENLQTKSASEALKALEDEMERELKRPWWRFW